MIGRTAWWLARTALGCNALPAHAAASISVPPLAAPLPFERVSDK